MSKLLIAVLALLLAVPLAACGNDAPPGQIEIVDLRLVRQRNGLPVVSGLFINRTPERIASADVGITLYDADNLPLDEPARLVVQDIAAGDSVRFRQRLDVDALGASLDYVIQN